jgi:hypothetical protein
MIYSYETKRGEAFVLARWDEDKAQFTSTDVPPDVAQGTMGYKYTFARTLEGLVGVGVRSYSSRVAAQLAEQGFQSPKEFRRRLAQARQDVAELGWSDDAYQESLDLLLRLEPLVLRREAELAASGALQR